MVTEQRQAALLQGCAILEHPDMPTLRVLRFDTVNEEHWFCLATKEILEELADECLKKAQDMDSLQS
jgi:hypothetical protein